MKVLLNATCVFLIAVAFIFATPIMTQPLFAAEETPAKVEKAKVKQSPVSKQAPVKTKAQKDPKKLNTVKDKATKADEDPIGTRR